MYREKEVDTTLPFNYQIKRSVRHSKQNFDLESLVATLKHDKKWKSGEMNMRILHRSPTKKIVLAVLHEDTEIISHQVNDSITFRVIEGMLVVHFLKESYTLHTGESLTLNKKTRYSINSLEETAFMMTLTT